MLIILRLLRLTFDLAMQPKPKGNNMRLNSITKKDFFLYLILSGLFLCCLYVNSSKVNAENITQVAQSGETKVEGEEEEEEDDC